MVSIATIVLGQGTNLADFGHVYRELSLKDAQGKGLVEGSDIKENSITARNIKKNGAYVELSVLDARNADAASCEFIIKSCNNQQINKPCSPGYSPVSGVFGFVDIGRDRDYAVAGRTGECIGNGVMGLCCKSP